MSRIKGYYKQGGYTSIKETRWLDTITGKLFKTEDGAQCCNHGFTPSIDGTWGDGRYVWVPDAVPELAADWYVLRVVPDEYTHRPPREGGYPPVYTTFGPYTEQEARANAALRSEKSMRPGRGPQPYAVVQVQAGNTVVVQPPAPPKLVENWS